MGVREEQDYVVECGHGGMGAGWCGVWCEVFLRLVLRLGILGNLGLFGGVVFWVTKGIWIGDCAAL